MNEFASRFCWVNINLSYHLAMTLVLRYQTCKDIILNVPAISAKFFSVRKTIAMNSLHVVLVIFIAKGKNPRENWSRNFSPFIDLLSSSSLFLSKPINRNRFIWDWGQAFETDFHSGKGCQVFTVYETKSICRSTNPPRGQPIIIRE